MGSVSHSIFSINSTLSVIYECDITSIKFGQWCKVGNIISHMNRASTFQIPTSFACSSFKRHNRTESSRCCFRYLFGFGSFWASFIRACSNVLKFPTIITYNIWFWIGDQIWYKYAIKRSWFSRACITIIIKDNTTFITDKLLTTKWRPKDFALW